MKVAWAATPSISVTRPVAVLSENLLGVDLIAPLTMVPGDSAAFVVTGTIRGGRRVQRPVSVVVTSRNPAIVTASGNIAVAIAPGSAWIVANASTGVSDSSFVTVAVGAPTSLTITPHTSSLVAGTALRATVAMTDRRGNTVTNVRPRLRPVARRSQRSSPDGIVTSAKSAGSVFIIAASGAAADTLRLTVTPPVAILGRLVPFPDSVTLNPGGATPIQVQALDSQGNPMAVPAMVWQSQTAGITVSSTGLIQAASTIASNISNGVVIVLDRHDQRTGACWR